MQTQTQILLDHFKTKPDISGMEARSMYRIEALPRRIADLREMGYVVNPVQRKDPTGKRYVRYVFLGKRKDDGMSGAPVQPVKPTPLPPCSAHALEAVH